MKQLSEPCPECGGGPVKPLDWRRSGRSSMRATKHKCSNCGVVETVPKTERRY